MSVFLRPFRPDEVDELWARRQREIAEGSVWGPSSREQVAERVAHSGTWTDTAAGLLFAVEADGVLVGDVQARRSQTVYLPPRHRGQRPQYLTGSAVTRSPGLNRVTSAPTSSITPAKS